MSGSIPGRILYLQACVSVAGVRGDAGGGHVGAADGLDLGDATELRLVQELRGPEVKGHVLV